MGGQAAIANLTRGNGGDWARQGLNINAIAPGYFRTELNAALIADENSMRGWKAAPPGALGETSRNWGGGSVSRQRTPRASSTAPFCMWMGIYRSCLRNHASSSPWA